MKFNDNFGAGPGSQPLDSDLVKNVDRILELIASGQRLITMAGPAGCGKTEHIVQLIRAYKGRVCVVAYMGQAVRMLQRRGIAATTIHSLIYTPRGKKHQLIASVTASIRKLEHAKGDPVRINALHRELAKLQAPGFVLNEASPLADADLCIIDEAGMCNERLARDLESFGKTMLVVGDPYQLMPVYGEGYYDLTNPDVPLTKIYRQDEGSEILTLATAIREGRKFSRAEIGPDIGFVERSRLRPTAILRVLRWADRIIVATNNTRRQINRLILRDLQLGPYPTGHQSEKLICLGNYSDAGLFNGTPVRLTDVALPFAKSGQGWLTARIKRDDGGDIWTDCGEHRIYLGHFDATAGKWHHIRAKRELNLDGEHIRRHGLIELDWAFATTCHKAQGSEWQNVLVILEEWPDKKAEIQRWQYTAVTRARSNLRIITNWNGK